VSLDWVLGVGLVKQLLDRGYRAAVHYCTSASLPLSAKLGVPQVFYFCIAGEWDAVYIPTYFYAYNGIKCYIRTIF